MEIVAVGKSFKETKWLLKEIHDNLLQIVDDRKDCTFNIPEANITINNWPISLFRFAVQGKMEEDGYAFRSVVLGTPNQFKIMQEISYLFVDGNFKCAIHPY